MRLSREITFREPFQRRNTRNFYHGTSPSAVRLVLKDGLKRRNQVYVHLSEDIETAYAVGKRHSANPVILKIEAKNLIEKGQEIL